MNYFLNQNGKALEETLKGSNSNVAKTTLRWHLRYFKVAFSFFQVPNPDPNSHPNSRVEIDFVLSAKIIEYAVSLLSLSDWFVLIETV